MAALSLNFENMPERHAELAWRFGEPDLREDGQNGIWTLLSPLPTTASLEEHLAWAGECLSPHEAFVGELISLGGKVVLRLDCAGAIGRGSIGFNARKLLPMAHTGVRIELQDLVKR